MTKTISVKLDIPQECQDDVLETFRQFNQACRMVLEVAWQEERKNYNKKDLHHATYYPIRDATDLPANLVCSARNRVAETVKACVTRWADGRKAKQAYLLRFCFCRQKKNRSVLIKKNKALIATTF
ncbi:MAG: hypothetical protein R6U51_04955 [Anaerolineales bacterium]